jgi:hypothetical protein
MYLSASLRLDSLRSLGSALAAERPNCTRGERCRSDAAPPEEPPSRRRAWHAYTRGAVGRSEREPRGFKALGSSVRARRTFPGWGARGERPPLPSTSRGSRDGESGAERAKRVEAERSAQVHPSNKHKPISCVPLGRVRRGARVPFVRGPRTRAPRSARPVRAWPSDACPPRSARPVRASPSDVRPVRVAGAICRDSGFGRGGPCGHHQFEIVRRRLAAHGAL